VIEALALMAAPCVACIIMVGIHAYLGLHVIDREVIFVDLALAQIAAFGATVGFLFGFQLHTFGGYLFSLGFALIGAGVFASTRLRRPIVPQEAIIGVVYAVAAAATILALSQTPEGGEELKALLVGHLLFIDWEEVIVIGLLYALVGLIHWVTRAPMLMISRTPQEAFSQGLRVRWWDFLFYATFGLVVTSSVEVAGVLLVFSFLIVPAICGALLAKSTIRRLTISWCAGVLTCLVGIMLSYIFDLPTGATIVCTFGVTLVFCVVLRHRR